MLELRPRRNALFRSNVRGGAEPVVANLSQLLVVLAPNPGAGSVRAGSLSCGGHFGRHFGNPGVEQARARYRRRTCRRELDVYKAAGYDWLACSTRTGDGMDAVLAACAGRDDRARRSVRCRQVIVDPSTRSEGGSRKSVSSYVRRKVDIPPRPRVCSICPGGGALIDSPGVRDFAPAIDRLDSGHLGFIEVARLGAGVSVYGLPAHAGAGVRGDRRCRGGDVCIRVVMRAIGGYGGCLRS